MTEATKTVPNSSPGPSASRPKAASTTDLSARAKAWLSSPDYADPAPQRPMAAPAMRVLARLADGLISGLAGAGMTTMWLLFVYDISEIRDGRFDWTLVTASAVFFMMLWEFLWLLSEGSTPGKQVLGLYVLDPTSRRGVVEAWPALKRLVLYPLAILPFGWLLEIALLAVSLALVIDDRAGRRSLTDRLANTTVRQLRPGAQRFAQWFWIWLMVAFIGPLVATLFFVVAQR